MLNLVQTIIVVFVSFTIVVTLLTLVLCAFITIRNKRRHNQFKFYMQNDDYREYENFKNNEYKIFKDYIK